MRRISSPLTSVSASYFDFLYSSYLADRLSVEDGWRVLFDLVGDLVTQSGGVVDAAEGDLSRRLASAFRDWGHTAATLDPLADGVADPEASARAVLAAAEAAEGSSAIGAAEDLNRAWAGSLAVELGHLDEPGLRAFLIEAMEALPAPATPQQRIDLLRRLLEAEEFERFFNVRLPTKKRFGIDGGEALIPLLSRLFEQAAANGVEQVVVGSMHRGRLNLMANVLGEPLVELIAKFKGAHPFPIDDPVAADVPYHLGLEAEVATAAGAVAVSLTPNPSHLEAVDPVVLGRVRARQDLAVAAGGDPARVLALVLHTDAAVVAQGVVAETLQLAGLAGYATAGTIHVIVDNRIGFTTEPAESRTSRHCTGPWKAIDAAILHVNGEDPEAALRAADIAVAYRTRHARDAVIHFVCYRRNGHNEIDEPRFTQPTLYGAIDGRTSVGRRYGDRLVAEGVLEAGDPRLADGAYHERLQTAYAAAGEHRINRSGRPDGVWAKHRPSPGAAEPETGVAADRLIRLLERLATIPAGLSVHPRLAQIVRRRAEVAGGVPWPTAEALALATLLTEGVPVRLSGQDVTRGAFSQRHFALTDVETGRRHLTLADLEPGQASFEVINSPLSEMAVLGFEYGYSLERPEALVIWEAQFGDFANGAQIILDQFVASGEEKWLRPSGLVLLLPHGLEGQGPEHSSARPERLLQLAAGDNLCFANPSTPANYFHLLRRQMLRRVRKPLLITAPKTLLRLPAAVSPLDDFGPDRRFTPVIASGGGEGVRRILFCTGKLAYELEAERRSSGRDDVAVVRLEELHPFPMTEIGVATAGWTDAEVVWVQEEPVNMGFWAHVDRRLEAAMAEAGHPRPRPRPIARPESSTPAGSFHGDHERDQRAIVEAAFA